LKQLLDNFKEGEYFSWEDIRHALENIFNWHSMDTNKEIVEISFVEVWDNLINPIFL
jgi:hypothetical protein